MRYALLILTTVFSIVFTARAQDTLRTPHGGRLVTTGFYKVELVECTEYVEVFLYETDLCPINNHGFTGQVEFIYPDRSCINSALYHYGTDGFTAKVEKAFYESCIVIAHTPGLDIRAAFGPAPVVK
jgi:hypothetical protein